MFSLSQTHSQNHITHTNSTINLCNSSILRAHTHTGRRCHTHAQRDVATHTDTYTNNKRHIKLKSTEHFVAQGPRNTTLPIQYNKVERENTHIAHNHRVSIHLSKHMKSLNHSHWPTDKVKHLNTQSNLQSSKQTYTNTLIYTVAYTSPTDVVHPVHTIQKPITACSAGAETVPTSGEENKELFQQAQNETPLQHNGF